MTFMTARPDAGVWGRARRELPDLYVRMYRYAMQTVNVFFLQKTRTQQMSLARSVYNATYSLINEYKHWTKYLEAQQKWLTKQQEKVVRDMLNSHVNLSVRDMMREAFGVDADNLFDF